MGIFNLENSKSREREGERVVPESGGEGRSDAAIFTDSICDGIVSHNSHLESAEAGSFPEKVVSCSVCF